VLVAKSGGAWWCGRPPLSAIPGVRPPIATALGGGCHGQANTQAPAPHGGECCGMGTGCLGPLSPAWHKHTAPGAPGPQGWPRSHAPRGTTPPHRRHWPTWGLQPRVASGTNVATEQYSPCRAPTAPLLGIRVMGNLWGEENSNPIGEAAPPRAGHPPAAKCSHNTVKHSI